MPRPPNRFLPHAIFLSLLIAATAWSGAAAMLLPLPDGPNDFNAPGFVLRHAWGKFAMLASRPFRGELSAPDQDAKVARYFELNRLVQERERIAGDADGAGVARAAALAELPALRKERARLENSVELILEGRLTQVIEEAGLTRHLGRDVVWPPVNIEFQAPPSVLVKSPRSEIKKESETLLQADLPIERAEKIEAEAERDGETSALVVEIGGIAMYPAIIPEESDYRYVLEDIAHEWMHHYLYFTPLGRRYFSSAKLTTLNETVADIVGKELGDMAYAAYPPPGARTSGGRSASPPAQRIDFTAEMRGLRREVEALLRDGRIEDAERLMEEKRRFLAANGYYIRKLNQAYFAFHGSYAGSAGSIDPIGPKLDALRDRSETLAEFVERARELTSEDALDRGLATP
ncbi:MAG: hypothetical protein HY874_08555 [Chloroflexi bacterium]|nr:hypothetical protein [Chloroflexota bacterium]